MLTGSSTAYIGQFQVRERLGASRAEVYEVYKVWNPADNRLYALKVLAKAGADPDQRASFLIEAQVIEKISHPNIVTIHSIGEDQQGQPFRVMELLQGQTLKDAIRKASFGPIRDRVVVALQLARALEHLHFLNIVHRRLHPEDVHVDLVGKVRMLNIGIGRTDADSRFRAPEAGSGEPTLSGNIYTFGLILFELMGGAKDASTSMPLPEVPLPVQNVIRRCTALDPAHRPASFAWVATELDRWLIDPKAVGIHVQSLIQPICISRKSLPTVAAVAFLALSLCSYAAYAGGYHLGQHGRAVSASSTPWSDR